MSTLPSQTLCARSGASNPLSSVSRDWSRTFSRPWAGGAAAGSRRLPRLRPTSPSSLIRNPTSRVGPTAGNQLPYRVTGVSGALTSMSFGRLFRRADITVSFFSGWLTPPHTTVVPRTLSVTRFAPLTTVTSVT